MASKLALAPISTGHDVSMPSANIIPGLQLRNIVFLTDFSEISGRAREYAAALARHHDATIHICHLVEPVYPQVGGDVFALVAVEDAEAAQREAIAKAEQRAEKEAIRAEYADTVREPVVRVGKPDAIPELLAELEADLVVVASAGREGLQRFFLGSFAKQVLHLAACPVLTVGPGSKMPDQRLPIRRVLLATDYSKQAEKALAYALLITRSYGARLLLVHVDKKSVAQDELDRMMASEKHIELMENLLLEDYLQAANPEFMVEFGKPAEHIMRVAAERDADLIVMGTRGTGFAQRLGDALLGDTAYHVVSHAGCPVLTVHS